MYHVHCVVAIRAGTGVLVWHNSAVVHKPGVALFLWNYVQSGTTVRCVLGQTAEDHVQVLRVQVVVGRTLLS